MTELMDVIKEASEVTSVYQLRMTNPDVV